MYQLSRSIVILLCLDSGFLMIVSQLVSLYILVRSVSDIIDCEGDFLCKLIHMFDSHKVSVCQRLNLEFMLIEHVKDYFKRIKENGFIDVRNIKVNYFHLFNFVIVTAKEHGVWHGFNSLSFLCCRKV